MSNNFHKTAVLKKKMNCKLKLHSKGFYKQILGEVTLLKFPQTLALDFAMYLSAIFPAKFQSAGSEIFTDKFKENYQKWFQRMQLHVTPANFFSRFVSSEALVYNFLFFLRTVVLGIRFSYKHFNFSCGWLLVKMASKTVIRPIKYAIDQLN